MTLYCLIFKKSILFFSLCTKVASENVIAHIGAYRTLALCNAAVVYPAAMGFGNNFLADANVTGRSELFDKSKILFLSAANSLKILSSKFGNNGLVVFIKLFLKYCTGSPVRNVITLSEKVAHGVGEAGTGNIDGKAAVDRGAVKLLTGIVVDVIKAVLRKCAENRKQQTYPMSIPV